MALHRLEVLPRDVDAGALGLLLDAPPPPALAELVLRGPGGDLVLGVIGASHTVVATAGRARLTEQVSCDAVAAGGRPLPPALRRTTAGYRMTSRRTPASPAALAATAAGLRARAADAPDWLCGAFPGDDAALTALTGAALPGGGWTWRTWHLYPDPEEGVIVTTRSRWTP